MPANSPSQRSHDALNKERLQRRVKRDQARSTIQQARVPAGGTGGQSGPSGPAGKSGLVSSPSRSGIPARPDIRDHHTRGILSTRTRRDALVPIYTLPPELLARIFHFHALSHPPLIDGRSLGWIVDTHVCQHWRQVALGDGSLWSDIKGPSAKNRWIPEMVARSKDAPLSISLLEPPDQRLLSMFLLHLPRIRELVLPGLWPFQVGEDVTRKILTHEAPILERFTLGLAGHGTRTSPIVPNQVRLFGGHGAPRLREVTLHGVNLPWSSFPRSPLTHLEVRAPKMHSLEHLMGVLAGCPTLELLSLHHCLPSTPSTLDQVSAVTLPNLRRLALTGTSDEITRMLEYLKLPPSSSLDIHCVNPSPSQGNPTSILPFIAAHFARPEAVTLRSLYVMHYMFSRHLVEIIAYGTLPGPEGHPSHDSHLNLQFEVDHDPGMLSGIVQQTFATLPFANVEYHDVIASDELRPLDWSRLRHRCSKIVNMSLMGNGAAALLKNFSSPKADVPRPSSSSAEKKRKGREAAASAVAQPIPFPNLTSLYVRDIDFLQRVPDGDGTMFDIVKDAMDRRKQCSVQLEKLEISRCIITANQARQLGEFVREFEWDEDEGQPEDPGYTDPRDFYAEDSDWSGEESEMAWEDL